MEFKSFEEAVEAFQSTTPDSPEWREALAYAVTFAPPPLKKIFDAEFKTWFPDLKPDFYDEQGNPYYEVEKTRKYFGVSREEVDEMVERNPEIVRPANDLLKVQ
jgi:hypothetical protein